MAATISDANNAISGINYVTGDALHLPDQNAVFIFHIQSKEWTNFAWQFAFMAFYGCAIWYRSKNQGNWQAWKEI